MQEYHYDNNHFADNTFIFYCETKKVAHLLLWGQCTLSEWNCKEGYLMSKTMPINHYCILCTIDQMSQALPCDPMPCAMLCICTMSSFLKRIRGPVLKSLDHYVLDTIFVTVTLLATQSMLSYQNETCALALVSALAPNSLVQKCLPGPKPNHKAHPSTIS